MNDKIQRKLKIIADTARAIISDMECVLEDIDVVESDDDLPIIEGGFERTRRKADESISRVRKLADDFYEDEVIGNE